MHNRFQLAGQARILVLKWIIWALPAIVGSVGAFQGTLFYDAGKPQNTSATIWFDAQSLSTAYKNRDEKLHGDEFLDSENHPWIWFQSTKAETSTRGITLIGNLIIKDQVKEVAVNLETPAIIRQFPQASLDRLFVTGSLTFKRSDYDLGSGDQWNKEILPGIDYLSDEVSIEFDLQGYSYTTTYLTNNFYKPMPDGSVNNRGAIFDILKEKGFKASKKRIEELKKELEGEISANDVATFLADLGWISMLSGYTKEAVEYYHMALQESPENVPTGCVWPMVTYLQECSMRLLPSEKRSGELPKLSHIPEMLKWLDGEQMTKSPKPLP